MRTRQSEVLEHLVLVDRYSRSLGLDYEAHTYFISYAG